MRRIIFAFLLLSGVVLRGQSNFYEVDTIQTIDLTFTQSNWDYQLDTAKAGADGYILAVQCVINGVVYDSVGVKYKGNSSYDSAQIKNPLHIKLDYTHGNASYNGVQDIKLGNGFSDPTSIREVLAYEILRNYMAAPQCNFARVTINGVYYGLYSSAESIESDFNSTHFYSSSNSFFKCTPQNVLSGQVPNLLYLGTDSANYTSRYEIKSSIAWKDLISLCDTLNNNAAFLDTILDIDRAIWMIAFNNVTVNLDSYSGAFSQNYYLYLDDNGRFNTIVWDLNMCFGGFTNTGTSNLNIAGMQTMTPLLHQSYGARPLIVKLISDSTYYRMYVAHMRTIANEFFADSAYYFRAVQLQALVDSSVQADSNSFYTYPQFQSAVSNNTGTIPGLTTLMDARVAYLQTTPQFTATPPTIGVVSALPAAIALYDTVWISCSVSNANNVYLGYRDQIWKKFTHAQMFDDGLHGDGGAGDGVFGAAMPGTSALMQYYVYAENSAAGMFSPERAEYEYYTYLVAVTTAGAGDIVINELLTYNATGATDASGAHEDWIELFNTTGNPLGLNGLYISDDPTNHLKCALPDVIVPAYGFLIVWADEDPGSTNEVHANFKLSSAGEVVVLSNASGTVLDSVAFAIIPTDQSYGRCPNGYGPWMTYSSPSFAGWNICPGSVNENETQSGIAVYPNPAGDVLNVKIFDDGAPAYTLVSSTGELVRSGTFTQKENAIDLSGLADGMYILMVRDENGVFETSERIIVEH